MYELAKFLHVAAAIVWVGGGLMVWLLNLRFGSAGVDAQQALTRAGEFFGRRLFQWLALVALLTGIWMVLGFDRWEFEQIWIALGVLGVFVSGGIGGALITPATRRLNAAYAAGDTAAAATHRARVNQLAAIDLVVLGIVVAAMVFKWGA